jgi:putative phosphoribosyl transferase
LGIPRGDVIIGWTIASKLSCDFGIIIPRKLRAPNNQELVIGALMEDGTTYLQRPEYFCNILISMRIT